MTQGVLFVAAVPQTVGFIAPLAEGLRARGIRVALAVGAGREEPIQGQAFDLVFRLPPFRRGSPTQWASATRALIGSVHSWRPDLLHLHTPYAVALGRVAARATWTDHIAVVHGTLFDAPGRAAAAYRAEERFLGRLTPTYVAVNQEDVNDFRRIAPRSRVMLAPCGGLGIDIDSLMSQAQEVKAGPPSDDPRVLVLGRMTPDKGLDLCVTAWRRLRESIPRVRLCFVGSPAPGDAPWRPPPLDGIECLPFTDSPGAALASSALLLSCSPREGFSLVVAEALLVGVPVVAVANRGTRRIAAMGVEGLTALDTDPGRIASAMAEALGSQAVHVPAEVRRTWSRDSVVSYHADVILDTLAGRT